MPRTFEIFDLDAAQDKFNEIMGSISQDEVEAWKHHECTQALLWGLLVSEMTIHEQWKGGNYTDAEAAGTAQLNSSALGMLKAIDIVKELILEDIGKND